MKAPLIIFLFVLMAFPNAAEAESASDYAFNAKNLPSGWVVDKASQGWVSDFDCSKVEKRCGIKSWYFQSILINNGSNGVIVRVSLYETAEGARTIINTKDLEMVGIEQLDREEGLDSRTKIDLGDEGYRWQSKTYRHVGYEVVKGNVVYYLDGCDYSEKYVREAMLILLGYKRRPAIPPAVLASGAVLAVLTGLGLLAKAMAAGAAKAAAGAVAKGVTSAAKNIRISMKPQVPSVQIGPKVKFTEPKEAPRTDQREEKKEKEKKEDKKKKTVARIEISAQPAEIVADGKSRSKVTVKVFDEEGSSVAGETVGLQLTPPSKNFPLAALTNVTGEVHLDYFASREEKVTVILARSTSNPQVTKAVQIKERKPKLSEVTLKAVPDEVVADGKSKAQIKIGAFDEAGEPVSGEKIELWFEKYDESKIEPQLAVTDVSGKAAATFTSGSISGEQELSARAQSNWEIRAKVKIKLKEEVYYEVKDNEGLFRLRVNIPSKDLTAIKTRDVVGARVLDRFDKEIKIGFNSTLIDLAALVGYYGIKSDAVYKAAHEKWQDVHQMCHKIAGDLDAGIKIGFTAGAMSVINSLTLGVAEKFGGKLISIASKVLGKADSALDESILSVETQDEVRFQIVEEKKCYERMASCAEQIADCWGKVGSFGGDPMSAVSLIGFKREIEFYELNDRVLEVASKKGKITKTFSDSDFAAITKDRENIKNTIHIATSQMSDIYELRLKIRESLCK